MKHYIRNACTYEPTRWRHYLWMVGFTHQMSINYYFCLAFELVASILRLRFRVFFVPVPHQTVLSFCSQTATSFLGVGAPQEVYHFKFVRMAFRIMKHVESVQGAWNWIRNTWAWNLGNSWAARRPHWSTWGRVFSMLSVKLLRAAKLQLHNDSAQSNLSRAEVAKMLLRCYWDAT